MGSGGNDNLGCRRGSGKADSSYKRFENRESAEILVDPLCALDYDSEDQDCWFSFEVSSDTATPIVVRPYCDNSTISSIIGWHDDDNASSDDDDSNIPVNPPASKLAEDTLQSSRQSKVRF